MRKLFAALVALSFALVGSLQAAERQKVILDTDMVQLFDDGIAMVMLANAPDIDLLGVVTVSGNTWAEEGMAYGARQLELIGRTDVPLVQGAIFPLRPGRLENMALERQAFGIGPSEYTGAFGHPRPENWKDFYRATYGASSPTAARNDFGADFIIDQVKKYPGQITIAAIGPCTNIALALRKAPEIAPLIRRIVYMGGAFTVPGNTTPAAEFNWWFDPEAARMAVRAAFPEQIVVGLDVCEKVHFTKRQYDRLISLPRMWPALKDMFRSDYGPTFAKNPEHSSFVWDLLVAAIIIDPSVIATEKTEWIDVDDNYGLDYGRSLSYAIQGPAGTRKASIVMTVNEPKFWSLVYHLTQKRR